MASQFFHSQMSQLNVSGQIYLGVFGNMPSQENFEIFNAKFSILMIYLKGFDV
jgi:hypothetical protein